MHHDKEDFTVRGCVLHPCRDTLHCTKREQVVHLVPSPFVFVVCKLTQRMSPPTLLDCVQRTQASPGTAGNKANKQKL